MHIVFLTNEYPKNNESHGGIGTFVQNLARNLFLKGIQVSIIGINKCKGEVELDKGVAVYRIEQSKAKFGKFIFNSIRIRKKLSEIHRVKPIDIVEGSELSFAFLPKKTSYKKIIRMHGGHHFFAVTLNKKPALWRSFQERTSFKKADKLISVSEYVGETTSSLLNLIKPYKTIYNFIDLEKFEPKTSVKVIYKSIVFIGTICAKKGVKELVEAFPIIKNKIPNANLLLIGRDWKSKEIPSYIQFLKENYIDSSFGNGIQFLGTIPQDEIPNVIANADICVYPSHMESFGLTVIEAMSMQKPIVFSNIPPFKEIITNNISGLECNPYDSNDIAEKIIDILSDSDKSVSFAKNARKEVTSKFDSESIIKDNIDFYKSCIN